MNLSPDTERCGNQEWPSEVEIDPRVLISNPLIWYRLEQDVQASVNCGSLMESRESLQKLSRLIDGDTRLICKVSGL
ncbi:hypothetical protein ACFY2N_09125 [Streptomyces rubiginosohelvolus]|uniref:hypothetical protein n=1 Tax=Streptomyces rubiginosohelvolus TaxID=67362 RepID=UPI0036C7F9AB